MSAKPLPLAAFAVATLLPAALLGLGATLGGLWLGAALFWMCALSLLLDQLLPLVEADAPEGAEFPAADPLLAGLALSALALLVLATHAATSGSLTLPQKAALLIATGLWLGQIAHPAAHELIHRSDRRLFRLGVLVYSALLIGHHASSHRLVHHRHVATAQDPATARRGEGFWRFLLRAGWQGFRQGLRAESARPHRLHPYLAYLGLAALALGVAAAVGGAAGVAVWTALALHAQMQIHLSDYVQHYGLTRSVAADGHPEPVGPAHSWNTAHWFSSALLLNAPRHSDHHAHPQRPYPALRLPPDAPRLPWPLPLAALIALVPPLWRRLMRPHLSRIRPPQ
ncbi:alkane 1-monooxygenase [Paragemmobacter straminiformis]|uniref:Alkane 1-monooxygenase n=1 Tax=Paragemmobacter straminiformis TaxID=2045119 RepID=A0A842I1Z5_9RHOB|nr:alkane 1-monooxygenase [Gemmobacter straminiformis]MBC2833869.1 alkane 1-monooxygenase [Gemmobacter straminiformis]